MTVVRSASGCVNVSLSRDIAIPVFCTPVSIAIAKVSGLDLLNIFESIQPNIKPNHGNPKPATTI